MQFLSEGKMHKARGVVEELYLAGSTKTEQTDPINPTQGFKKPKPKIEEPSLNHMGVYNLRYIA